MRKTGMEILWLGILLALSAAMGALLNGGEILLYIAPRMVPVVWFGFAVLIVLSAYQLWQMIKRLRRRQPPGETRFGVLLFLVPLILFATVTPNTNTPGSLPNQTVQRLSLAAESTAETLAQEKTSDSGQAEQAAGTTGAQTDSQPADMAALPPCVLEEETAKFDPKADLFSQYLHNTVEELVGKTITVYGFVYTDDSFPENTVLVSRMLIACCAADAAIVGFHVKTVDTADLTNNEWVRVTGTIQSVPMDYFGDVYDFPVMTDGIIVRCNAPDVEDAYVYP